VECITLSYNVFHELGFIEPYFFLFVQELSLFVFFFVYFSKHPILLVYKLFLPFAFSIIGGMFRVHVFIRHVSKYLFLVHIYILYLSFCLLHFLSLVVCLESTCLLDTCQNISSWSTFISYTFHNYPKVNPGVTMVPYPSFTRTFIVQSAWNTIKGKS